MAYFIFDWQQGHLNGNILFDLAAEAYDGNLGHIWNYFLIISRYNQVRRPTFDHVILPDEY